MTKNGGGILESLRLSHARMGRGSALCETHGCVKDIPTWAPEQSS